MISFYFIYLPLFSNSNVIIILHLRKAPSSLNTGAANVSSKEFKKRGLLKISGYSYGIEGGVLIANDMIDE